MLRTFVLLAWIPLLWQPTWGQSPSVGINTPKKKRDNATGSAKTTDPRGTKESPLVVDTLGHQQTPVEREEAKKEAAEAKAEEQYHRYVDRWTLIWTGITAVATGVLVFVGIGAIRAALRTLGEMRNQGGTAREAADAALLNAQALIASERPWFVASIEQEDHSDYWRVRITNKGRTPGHLNAMFSEYIFVSLPEDLPIPPEYHSPCFMPDTRFFVTGDSFTDREQLPGFNPIYCIEHERQNQTDLLVIYGRATYSDTFTWGTPGEIIHETRWCYVYHQYPTGRFAPCGPYAYNGYRDRKKNPEPRNPN
jgi:hypothetical protein